MPGSWLNVDLSLIIRRCIVTPIGCIVLEQPSTICYNLV